MSAKTAAFALGSLQSCVKSLYYTHKTERKSVIIAYNFHKSKTPIHHRKIK
jgi:hypothetical protein